MPRTVAFTSFTYAYLPRAVVLLRTLRAAHPDWEVVALLVEHAPDPRAAAALAEFDRVVFAHALGIPDFPAWMFRHDLVEACTAVKGRMMALLLDEGADWVVYLDPDIAVFHPLDSVARALDAASIVLTPHLTTPNRGWAAILDGEISTLRYGVYNLGFIAVRNDAEGRRFAGWWDGLLRKACYDAPEAGFFTDQKYCDLVPALFGAVHVLVDPGCNVASWNLSQRVLEIGHDGAIRVNGSLLKFYHFTKINGAGDVMTARYAAGNGAVHEIWEWYRREIDRLAWSTPAAWSYGAFADGSPIPRAARLAFRAAAESRGLAGDPFDNKTNTFCIRTKIPGPSAVGPAPSRSDDDLLL